MSMGIMASQAFSPNKHAGLQFWLDMADIGTIIDLSGDVSGQVDKSRNGRDAVQLVGANQPRTGDNTMNGHNVITFDGINDFLDYDGTFLAGSDYTVFVVEQRASDKPDNLFIGGDIGVPSANTILILGYLTNISILHDQLSNSYQIAVPAFTVKIPRIHAFTQNSVLGKKYYQDGGQQGSSVNTVPLVSYSDARIGSLSTFAFYEGDIGEVIIYDRTLSDGEREQADFYLSNKWGIALS